MKSFKNLAILFASALITLGANAQASTTPAAPAQDSKSKSTVMKDKTVSKTKPSGKTKTVTTEKPTKKVNKDASSGK